MPHSLPLPLADRIEAELEESFVRASGPGGQNVNKVATAVELRFDVARTGLLSPPQKARLRRLAGRRMTAQGVLLVRSDTYRTQERNRAEARARLLDLLERALPEPRPRVRTRTPPGERLRRREAKVRRSALKARRAKPELD